MPLGWKSACVSALLVKISVLGLSAFAQSAAMPKSTDLERLIPDVAGWSSSRLTVARSDEPHLHSIYVERDFAKDDRIVHVDMTLAFPPPPQQTPPPPDPNEEYISMTVQGFPMIVEPNQSTGMPTVSVSLVQTASAIGVLIVRGSGMTAPDLQGFVNNLSLHDMANAASKATESGQAG